MRCNWIRKKSKVHSVAETFYSYIRNAFEHTYGYDIYLYTIQSRKVHSTYYVVREYTSIKKNMRWRTHNANKLNYCLLSQVATISMNNEQRSNGKQLWRGDLYNFFSFFLFFFFLFKSLINTNYNHNKCCSR